MCFGKDTSQGKGHQGVLEQDLWGYFHVAKNVPGPVLGQYEESPYHYY